MSKLNPREALERLRVLFPNAGDMIGVTRSEVWTGSGMYDIEWGVHVHDLNFDGCESLEEALRRAEAMET